MGYTSGIMRGVALFCLILASCLGRTTATSMKFSVYEDHSGAPFQKVKLDPQSGNVYMAGRNTLFKLSENLDLLDKTSTGPIPDALDCDPARSSCPNAEPTDNVAKVLDIDPVNQFVLFCGSVKQGLCATVPPHDLTDWSYMNPSNRVNFAGGRRSVSAFFGHSGATSSGQRVDNTLYVATTYDGRPQALGAKALSARRVVVAAADRYNMSYVYEDQSKATAIDFKEPYKSQYLANYIYGFEHEGFSYFVTLQREGVNGNDRYETRLVRVCQNDTGFYSYTEIKLLCRKKNGITTFYNVAQAAHLAAIGQDMRYKFDMEGEEMGLYVTFAKNANAGMEPESQHGSGLCLFTMSQIRSEFQRAQKDCYEGRGNLLPWVHATEKACTSDTYTAINIDKDPDFCGTSLNVGIVGRYPLRIDTNVTTEHFLATSLRVVLYETKTIAVMGTSSGKILKVLVDGKNQPPYAVIDVDGDPASPAVARDMEFDRNKENVFAITGSRVTKVPIHSCGVYSDCSDCVLTTDPLECGWCENHCSTERECKSTSFSKDSCPPIMYDFQPKSGPLEGGTQVTIHGRYLGNATAPSTISYASVEVALVDCPIRFRNMTVIICETGVSTQKVDREVRVKVKDPTKTTEEFFIIGEDTSHHISFSYREPRISRFYPRLGPKSGGTRMTIQGEDLNIGSEVKVTVAHRLCEIQIVSKSEIVCITSPWLSDQPPSNANRRRRRAVDMTSEAEASGPVNVSIDLAHPYFNETVNFSYEDDPLVDSVHPQSSIMSGGFPVTVTGQHLHIILKPMIEATVGTMKPFVENCTAMATGTTMLCMTPNISAAGSEVKPTESLRVRIRFHLDGVEVQSYYFRYFKDPVIYQFDDSKHVKYFYEDETFLTIQGEAIDLAATEDNVEVFLGKKSCNVTKLGTTVIICKPDRPKELADHEPLRAVLVKIGNRLYDVGHVQFAATRTDILVAMIMGPCLALACILILVLILVWLKRTGRGPFRKKVSGGPNVRYSRSHEVVIGENREQVYRLTAENPYWSENPHSVRQRTVVPVTREPVIDDEARRLIDDSQLLIDRERLLLLEIIGQGHFGCVYRGFLKIGEQKEETEVAVKTLKSLTESTYVNPLDAKRFLEEALRMREFNHPHILRLIGVTMDKEDLPLVVLPFMKHGDLLSYIRNENNSPTVKDLITFGVQIAEGMAYLANLKFVHRDLAGRNCMLDDNMNCKVADFGLSRDIYERDYYSSDDRKAKLPVKWMALESLEKGIYNTKTDVWSYGVVLWELMTRGVCPYPDVDNWDIIKYLKSGRRMPQPAYCPDALYCIMLQCWDNDPRQRPPFCELVHAVQSVITSMELAQQRIGVSVSYINVPISQGYLYPQVSDLSRTAPDGSSATNSSAMSTLV